MALPSLKAQTTFRSILACKRVFNYLGDAPFIEQYKGIIVNVMTLKKRSFLKVRGFFSFPGCAEHAAKPLGEIHVKTLEEIRLEKANQRKGEIPPKGEMSCTTDDPSPVSKSSPMIRIKTFSEVLAEKKQRQLEEERNKAEKESLGKPKPDSESQKQGSLVSVISSRRKPEESSGKVKDFQEVRIKTLEEIKQEKALRMQQSGENVSKTHIQPERAVPGKRLLCITKPTGRAHVPYLAAFYF